MWRRVLVVWSASRLAVLSLGYLLTAELGWHRALQPWQTDLGAGGHRVGLGLLHPHLARRLPPRQARGVLPALPARDPGRARGRPGRRRGRGARSSRTWRCSRRWPACTSSPATGCPRSTPRRSVLYLVLSPYAFALDDGLQRGAVPGFHRVALRALRPRARPGGGAARVRRRADPRHRPRARPPLALRAWRRRTVRRRVLAVAPLAAFGAQAAWLQHAVGDPLGMVHVQAQWGGHPAFPLDQPRRPVLALRHHPRRLLPRPGRDRDRLPGAARPAHPPGAVPRRPGPRTCSSSAASSRCRCSRRCCSRSAASAWWRSRSPSRWPTSGCGERHGTGPTSSSRPTAQIIFFTSVALGYRPP